MAIILSRFAKSFLVVISFLSLFSMIAFLHPPARSYIDPWTGQLFGEGGVERSFGLEDAVVHGDVIMSRLGNATAKCSRIGARDVETITHHDPPLPRTPHPHRTHRPLLLLPPPLATLPLRRMRLRIPTAPQKIPTPNVFAQGGGAVAVFDA
ncbi:hypothetical protein AX17_002743 [Amanita inopinata Kibby_2008]|nr:hypothetical protein AX17_002743 [Amanita inopinata Kibby_2008]